MIEDDLQNLEDILPKLLGRIRRLEQENSSLSTKLSGFDTQNQKLTQNTELMLTEKKLRVQTEQKLKKMEKERLILKEKIQNLLGKINSPDWI